MWKPGETVLWRGILNKRIWHVQPTVVVKDNPNELVLILLPGTECVAEETYVKGKKHSRRWWDFRNNDWTMAKYTWHTNRLLLLVEPEKFYSTILFWDHESNAFLCYYINFQIPFHRNGLNMDTLDLELDIVISPDFSYRWKDVDDYQKAISNGIISADYAREIDNAKSEIFEKLEMRQYPFDGSWLDWKPDPGWEPPLLPENWDKI